MGEGYALRRVSNPRPDPSDPIIDIPSTPPAKQQPLLQSTATSTSSSSATTAGFILSWYCSNIGVLLLNKYLLSIYGYRFPIFLTAIHMLSCSLYSFAAVRWLRLVQPQCISSQRQFLKIAFLSLIFCLSVVCGNTSLRYIPVSFNQAIGATTPFFTAAFALLITWNPEPGIVYCSLLPVVLGIVVASNSEPLFHPFGFMVCLASTAGRALKSVVQGLLLTSDAEKLNSMNLLMYMAPIAAAVLFPISLWYEPGVLNVTLANMRSDPKFALLILANGTVAYLVNLTNFLVTRHTSALTLQVLGNAKAAVAAFVSVLIFKNPVTSTGVVGFGITVGGVVLYSEAKKRSKSMEYASSAAQHGSREKEIRLIRSGSVQFEVCMNFERIERISAALKLCRTAEDLEYSA